MRSIPRTAVALLATTCCLAPAHATYNATVTSEVEFIQQMSSSLPGSTPESVSFKLIGQPTVTCGPFQQFIISPTSVPDAQTRKNMLAILIAAKATGAQVQVAYDNTGGFCDQQMVAVYYLVLR